MDGTEHNNTDAQTAIVGIIVNLSLSLLAVSVCVYKKYT